MFDGVTEFTSTLQGDSAEFMKKGAGACGWCCSRLRAGAAVRHSH